MAPVLLRVDNRLVHGQVVAGWLPALKADTVLVLDDEAARNPLVNGVMQLAMPPGVTLRVEPVSAAIRALSEVDGKRALVLVRDVAQAAAVVRGSSLTALNLGNVHHGRGRRPVSATLNLSDDELGVLRELEGLGVKVEHRSLPSEAALDLDAIEARLGAGEARA